MLCSNCGKNEATIRYTRIINGEKTEFALCEDCARKEGLDDLDFSMPINFSSFLSDFFEDDSILPSISGFQTQKCKNCGLTYDEFIKGGKFGCGECYNTFSNKLESILKNLHGSSKHIGRKPKNILDSKNIVNNKKEVKEQKVDENQEKIDKLNSDLQSAIKDERYEDAAKIRDEIKKLQK